MCVKNRFIGLVMLILSSTQIVIPQVEATNNLLYKIEVKGDHLIYNWFYPNHSLKCEVSFVLPRYKVDVYDNPSFKNAELFPSFLIDGTVRCYDKNGKLRRNDSYKMDSLISASSFNKKGEKITHCPFLVRPSFPGGYEALLIFVNKHIYYPPILAESSIQGKVLVQFIVRKTGKLSDFKVIRSLDPCCDKVALEVLKKIPSFNPGKIEGRPVDMLYVFPVTFKLE